MASLPRSRGRFGRLDASRWRHRGVVWRQASSWPHDGKRDSIGLYATHSNRFDRGEAHVLLLSWPFRRACGGGFGRNCTNAGAVGTLSGP